MEQTTILLFRVFLCQNERLKKFGTFVAFVAILVIFWCISDILGDHLSFVSFGVFVKFLVTMTNMFKD